MYRLKKQFVILYRREGLICDEASVNHFNKLMALRRSSLESLNILNLVV